MSEAQHIEEDYQETRTERVVSLVSSFFDRNKATSLLGAGAAGALISQPPNSVGDVAARMAITAGILGVGHAMDRAEAKRAARREVRKTVRNS